jgi:hypothetical protein
MHEHVLNHIVAVLRVVFVVVFLIHSQRTEVRLRVVFVKLCVCVFLFLFIHRETEADPLIHPVIHPLIHPFIDLLMNANCTCVPGFCTDRQRWSRFH